jgi:hypothetical protein
MYLSRTDVRWAVDCPECGAPIGKNCVKADMTRRISNHAGRLNKARVRLQELEAAAQPSRLIVIETRR